MTTLNPDDHGTLFVEKPVNFEQVPEPLFMDTNVPDGALRLWIVIRSYGGRNNENRVPSRRTLAEDLNKSVRTVDERLGQLVALGWLLITPRWRKDAPGQTSNSYQLLWTRIQGEDDLRLVAHKEAVAAFETEMEVRAEANRARRAVDNPLPRRDRSVRKIPGQTPVQNPAPPQPRAGSCAPRTTPIS